MITRLLRRLRWKQRGWSSESDREYHDQAFAGGPANPFSFAYPGYITIRRFADLAAVRLAGASRVLDVGCGPGEITCELATRFPACRFEGFDHSGVAVERARAHAVALGLANVTFTAGDALAAVAGGRADVVLMFDSFHHLLDPVVFVQQMGTVTDRFLLVEPAGTPLGGWRRTLDADWIALDLDTVRARIEHLLGCPRVPGAASAPAPHTGEAVEHRYALEDFDRFFDGYGLDVRGTIAGLDVYPPAAAQVTPFREILGRYAYELVSRVDDELFRRDRDLAAKHWVIYAERGRSVVRREPPSLEAGERAAPALKGAYDVRYVSYDGPRAMEAGTLAHADLTLENLSWRTWSSDALASVQVSYHWWRADRVEVERDGVRSRLPRPVEPGSRVTLSFAIRAPERPGRYLLAVDVVEEGVAWFSDGGAPPLTVAMTVKARE